MTWPRAPRRGVPDKWPRVSLDPPGSMNPKAEASCHRRSQTTRGTRTTPCVYVVLLSPEHGVQAFLLACGVLVFVRAWSMFVEGVARDFLLPTEVTPLLAKKDADNDKPPRPPRLRPRIDPVHPSHPSPPPLQLGAGQYSDDGDRGEGDCLKG